MASTQLQSGRQPVHATIAVAKPAGSARLELASGCAVRPAAWQPVRANAARLIEICLPGDRLFLFNLAYGEA